jgi:hypothetical protein
MSTALPDGRGHRLPPAYALVVATSAGLATLVAIVPAHVSAEVGFPLVGTVLVGLCFCVWPWAVLPVGVIGGTVAAVLLGETSVRSLVALHLLPLVAGTAALGVRRLVLGRVGNGPAVATLGMTLLLVATAVGATYGLAAGNAWKYVLVATYEVAVIPVYYLLAVHTLDTRERLRNAGILYIAVITLLTVVELGTPGRHGGLLTLIAVPPLIVLAGRARGWPRAGYALLASVLAADVVLASYRGIWLAAGLAIGILVLFGNRATFRGLFATAGTGAALMGLLIVDRGLQARSASIVPQLNRGAGYRVPESVIGFDVFSAHPIVGAGLGQTTAHTYVEGFTVVDVGPVYHAFYVLILANGGLIGLCAIVGPVLLTVWSGLRDRGQLAVAFAGLTCGYLAAALVSSPSDGHWELGLLPALTMLVVRTSAPARGHGSRPTEPSRIAPRVAS